MPDSRCRKFSATRSAERIARSNANQASGLSSQPRGRWLIGNADRRWSVVLGRWILVIGSWSLVLGYHALTNDQRLTTNIRSSVILLDLLRNLDRATMVA